MIVNGISIKKSVQDWKYFFRNYASELQPLFLITAAFLGFMLLFGLHRYYTFYTSYDHGLFNQLYWNSLHGHFFQSSLTSSNSIGVLEDGKIPTVNFSHLAHHFVPNFMLWLPLYALFPSPVTLVVLQIVLMAAGGIMLYALARIYLNPLLALLITAGYFSAIAVISPTFANFYEHCQIPLFVFALLWAMEKQRWALFWIFALLVLGIREDTGLILFGVGLYMIFSRRFPKTGIALCVLSFAYVAFVTNIIQPQFSDDAKRLYLATRFKQFVKGNESPSTLQVLWGMLTHPVELAQSLLTPFDRRFFYLVGQWLPLAFVPAFSPASWTIAGIPLLALVMQTGKTALSISVRYAVAIVPGMFYGAILWWAYRSKRPQPPFPEGQSWLKKVGWTFRTRQLTPAFRQFWVACMVVSMIATIMANPNQAFYFLIPDSIHPWVFVPLTRQWEHTAVLNRLVSQIPADASVSATTYVIPQLSSRRAIIRPPAMQIKTDAGQVESVDYVLADLLRHQQYQAIFKPDRVRLQDLLKTIDEATQSNYGFLDVQDGVVLLKKGASSTRELIAAWGILKQDVITSLTKPQLRRGQ